MDELPGVPKTRAISNWKALRKAKLAFSKSSDAIREKILGAHAHKKEEDDSEKEANKPVTRDMVVQVGPSLHDVLMQATTREHSGNVTPFETGTRENTYVVDLQEQKKSKK